MKIDRKIVLLKEASVSASGRLEGYGAVYGNVDDGGDEIERGVGAMAPALPRFMSEGFVSWGHDWDVPVAMPKAATEDEHGLYLDAQFHSTPAAQEKRTITRERLAAGLTMGLSIGYGDIKAERFPEKRLIKSIGRLYEVSLVMVPMNVAAGVAGVKAADGMKDCPTCDGTGTIMAGNRKCPDCNGTGMVPKGRKSASDDVSSATMCLNMLNELIESESMDATDATDGAEIDALVTARDALLAFIAAESSEVGTTADLAEAAAEDAAAPTFMGRSAMTLDQHGVVAKSHIQAYTTRLVRTFRPRLKEGRVISSVNDTRLEGWETTLAAMLSDVRDLRASAKPKTDTGKALRAAEIEYLLGQFAGIAIA